MIRDLCRLTWLLFIGVSCVMPGESEPAPPFSLPAISDGETSVYTVSRNDTLFYRARVTIGFDEELAPGANPNANEGEVINTGVVTTVTEPVSPTSFFYDSSTVVFTRDSLKPIRSYRSLETDVSECDVAATYSDRAVTVRRQTLDGNYESDLQLSRTSYSSDMIRVLLRAVPLVSGTAFRVKLVVPMDVRVTPARVLVLGTKLISTPIGDIMCREIVLILPAREVRYWFELAEPRRLVGIRDSDTGTVQLLAEYELGGQAHFGAATP